MINKSIKSLLVATTVFSITSLSACGNNTYVAPIAQYTPPPSNNIYIAPELPSGNVMGTVLDFDTKLGIAGVTVTVKGVRPVVTTITDASGKFTLNKVPEGRQVLLFSKKDYTTTSGNNNVFVDVKAGNTITSQTINLFSEKNSSNNAFVKVFEGFKHPKGISLNRTTGEMYVVDIIGYGGLITFDRAEIKKVTSDGGLVESFGSRLLDEQSDIFRLLKKSSGIGVDAGGNIFVADTGNNSVKKFGPAGRYISKIEKDFKNVVDVAITTTGDIIISDPGNSRVILLDSSLTIRIDNLLGNRPSDNIRGIATDNADNIYVIDASGKIGEVIRKFDKYGNPLPLRLGSIGSLNSGTFNDPTDLAIDNRNGDIYVVDSGNNRVQRFNAEGNFLGEFGQFGNEPGSFNTPWGIAVDKEGYVYIADSKNQRIQKFMPGRKITN